MSADAARERLTVAVVGHVDHGKSTVVGRLLADTGSLPKGKLDQVKDYCARNSKPFEYAFLLDALKDEQSQGITIDVARVFFRSAKRDYLIIDAPGHVEFIKNMVSGASHAAAALLVIDAAEGVRENSRRHGTLLSLLGVSQIAVLVNKMDAVGHRRDVYERIVAEYRDFLEKLGVKASAFIPVSAARGENLASRSPAMGWYAGPTALEALDAFRREAGAESRPFRMPVQDVYKFTADGDERRIVAGTVESGAIRPGDAVVFYPSGKTSVVKSLEGFPRSPENASAGQSAGFTLAEQVYLRRGELAARAGEPPPLTARRLRASVFWLGREPLRQGRDYALKLGTARVRARLESVTRALDAASLESSESREDVRRHEAAECVLRLDAPLAFDLAADNPALGRFVLVDGYEISGGGLAREALADPTAHAREQVILRNKKWRKGLVDQAAREERLGQRAGLVLVTGCDDELRRAAAKALERRLFSEGRLAYFLGIGSVLYGLDADVREGAGDHAEDIRRLAELAYLMIDAGLLLVVTASRLRAEDLDLVLTAVDPARVLTLWVGAGSPEDLSCDARIEAGSAGDCVDRMRALLVSKGLIKEKR